MKLLDTLILLVVGFASGALLMMFLQPVPAPQTSAVSAPSETPTAEIRPTASEQQDAPPQYARAATLVLENDGHFYANAVVNNNTVRFLVDTGASSVALSFFDAQRLGLNPESLDYNLDVSTAGGNTKAAFVLLDRIMISNVEVENVEALVLRTDLKNSLLGMTFLRELYSYEFRRRSLILRQ